MNLRILLWKNYLVKKRHFISTLMEFLVPIGFIVLFGYLKTLETDVNVPAGYSSTNTVENDDTMGTSYNLFTNDGLGEALANRLKVNEGFSVPKFAFTETTMAGLMLSMNGLSLSESKNISELSQEDQTVCSAKFMFQGFVNHEENAEYGIPKECGNTISPYKIAIAPDNTFTRKYFYDTVKNWHPRTALSADRFLNESVFVVPDLKDMVMWFDSTEALDDYVGANGYGDGPYRPKIYAGIVFDAFPSEENIGKFESIKYAIRMNSTESSRNGVGFVPKTDEQVRAHVDKRQKTINVNSNRIYTTFGFSTLQTLVNRFIICLPKWDGESQSTNGECGIEESTAEDTAALNERFFKQYENDLILQQTLGFFNEFPIPFEVSLDTVPDSQRSLLLRSLRQAPQPYFGAMNTPFAIEAFTSSPFYDAVGTIFPLVFLLSYLYSLSKLLKAFVFEKETKARELIKIMGANEYSIIVSWYMIYGIIGFIASMLQTVVAINGVFSNSNFVLVFLYFFLFSLDVIAFSYLVSTMFKKSKTASLVGVVCFFIFYMLSSVATAATAEDTKNLMSLLAPIALTFGAQSLASAEANGIGMNFSTASELYENYRFVSALVFMAIDFVLYTIIGAYLEQVIPKEYGTTKPWNFPFKAKYWKRGKDSKKSSLANKDDVAVTINTSDAIEPVSNDLREQESSGKACTIKNLRKVFSVPGGEKVAVDSLDLNIYEGQITCLLGHNGAGKTTAISMLTGMLAPTSGDAMVRGHSLVENMDEIRKSLGICPQHDVLYPELTVREHLLFFGSLKGMSGDTLNDEVDHKIVEVGLTEKANAFSTALSGGMKRKLSVAIALLGDSKVVFLDEPTSGMDPYSRRATWELLQNNRQGRIIVLTTHFMDEADLLGDRIAIMADGQLRCCGSSLFLKNRYGAGYNLTMVKNDSCDTDDVIHFVSSHAPKAKVLSNVGTEISFQLPLESSRSFPKLFEELDANLSSLRIAQYGISVTTLEEVFLKVAEEGDVQEQKLLRENSMQFTEPKALSQQETDQADSHFKISRKAQKWYSMLFVHIRALLTKRFNTAKRDKKGVAFSILAPAFLLIVGFGALKASSFTKDQPSYALNANEVGTNAPTPFYCEEKDELCSVTMKNKFGDANLLEINSNTFREPPYESDTPTVFDITYDEPSINATDTSGYTLRMGEVTFESGHGTPSSAPVLGQFGSYLVHASANEKTFGYNVLVNTTATHGLPIYKSLMDQAIYRTLGSTSENVQDGDRNPTIEVSNHPLPLSASTKALFNSFVSFMAVIFIVIAFAFFPAAIVTFIVKEKESHQNSKHQQLVSGVSLPAFWISNYIWDFIVYLIPGGLSLLLIQVFNITSFTGEGGCLVNCTTNVYGAVIILFLLFGLAIIPFTYVLSYLFKQHSTGQNLTLLLNFVLGVVLMVVSFALDVIDDTEDVNKILKFFWRLSPLYCLGNGLFNLSRNDIKANFALTDEPISAFSTDIMGWELLYLAFEIVLFFALALGIDLFLSFPKLQSLIFRDPKIPAKQFENIDSDVQKEEERIINGNIDDLIQVKGLRKVYPGGKVAVHNLHFGLKQGECFGFLGINGAGKTTTLKMMTGDVLPSKGNATLDSKSILSKQIEIRRLVGYCPQFDALLDLMTVREHLELFGRIKGVPAKHLDRAVLEKLHQMDLTNFETKLAGSLSGGNKRKLSVAIAMMGSPPIIFLDEPSTGMDPQARRFMWKVIADISTAKGDSTIILTTHSMEECEALCSKVGIMVGGRMRCYGSIQHLKGKYGDGLMMEVKLNPASAEAIKATVDSVFDGKTELTMSDIESISKRIGKPDLFENINEKHVTGWLLHTAITRDESVSSTEVASWWIGEQRMDRLQNFIAGKYPASTLLERHNEHCRYKIRDTKNSKIPLSAIFENMESERKDLHIKEYSVSQTSLEQIFNQFASQQDEEKGVARGMHDKKSDSYKLIESPKVN